MYIFYCHLCNDVFESVKKDPVCNWCHSEVVELVENNSPPIKIPSDNSDPYQFDLESNNFIAEVGTDSTKLENDDIEFDSVSYVSDSSSCKTAVAESIMPELVPQIKKRKKSRHKNIRLQPEEKSDFLKSSLHPKKIENNFENNETVIVGHATVSLADSNATPQNSLTLSNVNSIATTVNSMTSTVNSIPSTIPSSDSTVQNTYITRIQSQNINRNNHPSFLKKLNKMFRKETKIETVSIKAINYSERDSCSICLDLFKTTEHVRLTQCGHLFHSKCLAICLKSKNSCPNCRSEFVLSNTFGNLT